MAEEMRFHLARRAADYAADGLPDEEARLAAQRKFGNLGSIQEQAREAHGWGWLERALKDLRFALRQLRAAGIGQRFQQNAVEHTEHRGVGPDAEPERDDGQEGEAGGLRRWGKLVASRRAGGRAERHFILTGVAMRQLLCAWLVVVLESPPRFRRVARP